MHQQIATLQTEKFVFILFMRDLFVYLFAYLFKQPVTGPLLSENPHKLSKKNRAKWCETVRNGAKQIRF